MKARSHIVVVLSVLFFGLLAIPTGLVRAQTFESLYAFTNDLDTDQAVNGSLLWGGLVLSGSTLYGTTATGGADFADTGTVFTISTNGMNFESLYTFSSYGDNDTNYEGATPEAGLILSGTTLYGTATLGGAFANGSVFAMDALTGTPKPLHSFSTLSVGFPSTNSDGAFPQAALFLYGTNLYGTAYQGGTGGYGTVFSVNMAGTVFKTLHSFANGPDGFYPYGGVIVSSNQIYGTARYGSLGNAGLVFSLSIFGTNFIPVHFFAPTSGINATNSEGANPYCTLLLTNGTLYGTAEAGGTAGYGSVFSVSTNGQNFVNLHSFPTVSGPNMTNSDGALPYAGLVMAGDTLYGTATQGGTGGSGTVFSVTTNRVFTTVYSFSTTADPDTTNTDGAQPLGGLVLADNVLYGTTWVGGQWSEGTVFKITLASGPPGVPQPRLAITESGTSAIVKWPTNAAGYTLQSNTNLDVAADWTTVTPGPKVVTTNNVVTNNLTGTQKFYRLMQ